MSDSVMATPAGSQVSNRMRVSEDFDTVMARIADKADVIRAGGEEGEALGGPTAEVVSAVAETGVFRMSLPREVGGYEFTPSQLVQTMEALAWHESSTAWNVLGASVAGYATGAFTDDAAVEEYFGGGRTAKLSGQGTKQGEGKRVEGGYLISGHWQFNSGSPVATHIHTGVLGDDGVPFVATLPIEQVELISNWDVLGLRATGSSDYRIDNVFVPDTHLYNPVTPEQKRGGAVYRVGLPNIASLHHAGWALGVSKRLLEEMRNVAKQKGRASDQFFAAYAEMEGRYRAGRALVLDLCAEIEEALDGGGELSTDQLSSLHLAVIYANRGAQVIANDVATWAGTAVLRPGILQRYFRDVYTGVQHMLLSPTVQQNVGKQMSGLANADAFWVFYDLVEPA